MSTQLQDTIQRRRNHILSVAREHAREKRVGTYGIAVTVNGLVQEVSDLASLDELLENHSNLKYEGMLIDGKASATGAAPSYASGEIFLSLRHYAHKRGVGIAVSDNVGFWVSPAHERFVSPDVAYHIGAWTGMKFFEGARFLPSRFEAKVIMARQKNFAWLGSDLNISQLEPLLFGMSTY